MDQLLFVEGDLRATLETVTRQLVDAVEAALSEHVDDVDVKAWAAALAEDFAVACPVVRRDEIAYSEPEQITLDVSRDNDRYFSDPDAARRFPGTRLAVHVPFSGDPVVFRCRASTFGLNPPRAKLDATASEVVWHREWAHGRTPEIKTEFEQFLSSLELYLGYARGDIDAFNRGLVEQAHGAIVARQGRLAAVRSQVEALGLPKRGAGGKQTVTIVRRPAPRLHASRAGGRAARRLEPVLEDAVYEHLLDVIRTQLAQIARSPATYERMGEEDLRQTIVAMLTTHYDTTAESFNLGGKTDVLIQHDGRNLFIAECKFWDGSKKFTDTIDQLFGYTSWNDTKLAIVIFVRERGLSEIVEKARRALEEHPQFARWGDAGAEAAELRAEMTWPGDTLRRADLHVFLAPTPRSKAG